MWRKRGQILTGRATELLVQLPDESIHTCITSPPYWALRDYGCQGQIGLEATPDAYIASLCAVFEQVRRVLRSDGTLWLNLGDTYIGYHGNRNATDGNAPSRASTVGLESLKNKDLVGIPWRVAFALQEMGWYLRTDIIWHKPNAMPESVKDRPTRSHEYIFLFSKEPRYYYDHEAVREKVDAYESGKWQSEAALTFARKVNEANRPNQQYSQHRVERAQNSTPVHKPNRSIPQMAQKTGSMGTPNPGLRNCRSVWTIATRPYREAHFATFPPDLVRPCLLAGCPENGVVLDPFFGSGTVGQVAIEENRHFLGIELNPEYVEMAERRLEKATPKSGEQCSLFENLKATSWAQSGNA